MWLVQFFVCGLFGSPVLSFILHVFHIHINLPQYYTPFEMRHRPTAHRPLYACSFGSCFDKFRSLGARTRHINSVYRDISLPPDDERGEDNSFRYARHMIITGVFYYYYCSC